jgi:CHAD domain-containing protein
VPKSSKADLLREIFTSLMQRIVDLRPAVIAGGNPEALHEFRVALRRLRSNARSLRKFFSDQVALDKLFADLTWLDDLVATARDAEVLVKTINAAAADELSVKQLTELSRHLLDHKESARVAMLVNLGSKRAHQVLADGESFLGSADFKREHLKKLRGQLKQLGKQAVKRVDSKLKKIKFDSAPPAKLHTIRIIAKRARYLLEATGQIGELERMVEIQSLLGELNDLVVAGKWLKVRSEKFGLEKDIAKTVRAALRNQQSQQRQLIASQL